MLRRKKVTTVKPATQQKPVEAPPATGNEENTGSLENTIECPLSYDMEQGAEIQISSILDQNPNLRDMEQGAETQICSILEQNPNLRDKIRNWLLSSEHPAKEAPKAAVKPASSTDKNDQKQNSPTMPRPMTRGRSRSTDLPSAQVSEKKSYAINLDTIKELETINIDLQNREEEAQGVTEYSLTFS